MVSNAAHERLVLCEDSPRQVALAPPEFFRPTNPQHAWLALDDRLCLWRAGNQIGKSYAQAWDIVAVARGVHPYRKVRRGPKRILVVSYSWDQMDPLLEKLWAFLPKHEIDPKVSYEPGSGIRGYKNPHIKFIDGPGKGSVIYFATYKQGSKRIAGGSYDLIVLDEPPPEAVWGEIRPRINARSGQIRVTLTPTPESPPLGYLREKVEAKEVRELQTTLGLDAVTPRGGLLERPWMTEEEIEAFIRDCLAVERAMRVEGAWDPLVEGRWLTNYSPACREWYPPPAGARLCVGVDHGAAAGKQRASLVAIEQPHDLEPHVWLWDECGSDGLTTPEQDAAAVLAMLRRNDLEVEDVDVWIGDRSTNPNQAGVYKSNSLLRSSLAYLAGVPVSRFPRIRTPRKYTGSVTWGFRLLNAIMGRRDRHANPDGTWVEGPSHFLVHPRCTDFDAAVQSFRGQSQDPAKDVIDSVRYPVELEVRPGGWFSFRAAYG